MCLDGVDKKPKVEEGIGYKVGYIRTGLMGRKGPCFVSGDQQTVITLSRWIRDRRTQPIRISFRGATYPAGFHIFFEEIDARRWSPLLQDGVRVVAKVKFKDVQVTGTQIGGEGCYGIAVARRICILKPKNL